MRRQLSLATGKQAKPAQAALAVVPRKGQRAEVSVPGCRE
jgi:hypothetical protein